MIELEYDVGHGRITTRKEPQGAIRKTAKKADIMKSQSTCSKTPRKTLSRVS